MDKYLGKRLDARYEIHELIGVGGMANVYRCTDTLDDREVAIKILKDEYLNNQEFIRRFKNESKAIAMLSHPNIVKVYDVSFGDVIQYIVMEYIDGITLKEYIDRQGVIEWKDVLHLIIQVLRALQHAHESGIVHRDVKPQNIMLLQDGTIKMTDFGIARFSDKATRTMTDQAIGSVHYIAPEQARGDVTDGKTDIYSVGVMLYEMLTGKLPFEGETAVSVALMQLQSTPKRPREVNPSIPVGLEQITMRAMEKQPAKRYTSAAEMLSDIERFRLNPSIVFDYGSSFVDDQPTKYVNTGKLAREEQGTRYAPEERKKPAVEDTAADEEDEVKDHGVGFDIFKGILIGALAVVVVFFALAVVRGFSSNQTKDVDVPQFTGKTLVEVKENNPENFQFEIKSKYDESKSLGTVLAQDPEAGSMKVKSGSVITLTINSNQDEITVPFFTSNYKQAEAVKALKDASLIPEVVLVENTKTAKDYVITTFPAAGAKAPIGSTVYLYVSNGERPQTVEIPAVIGTSLSEAQEQLSELGMTVEVVYDDESKEPRDTVLSSSPLPHGKIEKGTVVTLTVSSGVGDKSTVTINVDLPAGVTDSIEMTVIVDGAVDTAQSKTVIPAYGATAALEFKGSGTSYVVVQLGGQVYREYTIDFSTGSVSTVTHEYVVPTEAPTEAPTEYSDPEPESSYVEESSYTESQVDQSEVQNDYNYNYNNGY